MENRYIGKKIDVLDHGHVTLVDHMGTDSDIVAAARVSYGKGTKKKSEDRALIRYCMRHRHTSVFEQVMFKFHCKMPMFVARQWVRHRTAKINELSGRYSEMPDTCYVPELDRIQEQSKDNKQGSGDSLATSKALDVQLTMQHEQRDAFHNYGLYLKEDTAREIARINLPLSTYTEWYWLMDLHNLFHFLKLRMDPHAQYEIRVYADAIFELIKPVVPVACEAFEDYILNAKTFSANEVEMLRHIVKSMQLIAGHTLNLELNELQSRLGTKNTREMTEFLQKLAIEE